MGDQGEQYITPVSLREMKGTGGDARLYRRAAMDRVVPRQHHIDPDALTSGCARGPMGDADLRRRGSGGATRPQASRESSVRSSHGSTSVRGWG
jgi:hypothetical protein